MTLPKSAGPDSDPMAARIQPGSLSQGLRPETAPCCCACVWQYRASTRRIAAKSLAWRMT
eukprot:CAMPEP_0202919652 /NCGR_PEP_ID=MMETSP1392-20130828/76374_1 /ASSEMBLY_ACC=CAM_ASM_000868 /TAXON_ID=225041 /ORGANISM="Chlamydomonas chlamydogama, Strain SAG 11-48b" /LENGTH=59 /DNA_ID=CAMNT_0049613097 /DNA_START=89 /DNA_END=264 /DNA_ORIENTATION=-